MRSFIYEKDSKKELFLLESLKICLERGLVVNKFEIFCIG